jgi:hypothetical protein
MGEKVSSFVNVTMWHGGRFSTATNGNKDVIDGATPLVLDAIRRIPDTDTAIPFTLTDMGCADGEPRLAWFDGRPLRCALAGRGGRSGWFIPISLAMITIASSISSTALPRLKFSP